MEYVAVRAPVPMSRRTRHAHQLAADPTLPPPSPTTTTRNGGQQHDHRRMDLEHEMAELKQQLSSEATVHHILESALRPNTTSTSASARSVLLNIPAFIPAKAKQLLAELVVVEEEIARLESQIHDMRGGLVTTAQRQRASMATAAYASSYSPSVYTSNGNGNGAAAHAASARLPADQLAPEIKSMFFISQAMNAEYLQRHLPADDTPERSPRDHTRGPGATAISPKFNEKIFGLPPRNSHDKKQSNDADEKPPRASQEPSPPPATAKRDEQSKVQPNKLSERIVKCLAVIFIRLLRSSRAAEMDKSGSLARSGNLLQGSFRIDAALNVAASVAKEKERGQQDHYGIFEIQDSMVRDIGPYKNLVRFTSSAFDLRGFSTSPLLTKLREMLETLQQVDLRFLTHQQKLAFWLNIYNTCIMHGILQHGLPSNSEKLLALKNQATINVSGQEFNALVIENFILRQPSSVKEVSSLEFWKCDVDVKEQQVRSLYGLNSSEPNILFAMCCGIRSSPALRIYKADRVMAELEKAKLDYLQASLVVISTKRLMIPSLIHSNMHDFAKDMESLLRWICDQLPTSWSLRKSMVDCLRGHLKVEDVVEVIPYDYEFQYLLPK
ncbi:uncharacterized protein LOC123406348 isoform X3 [Hordeum vulgare subsp. vulgare]|uniref:uncharacterized protein LOC123406348 isoform X3 n=1 Tax=Hordeum vulgare subsp. vulgare TaxID=112509 RepID=UPI001D1A4119|nr:uncharacterized protein LOC123406348 isoform X3 [Hordeum vulgare subsp. vulgare]